MTLHLLRTDITTLPVDGAITAPEARPSWKPAGRSGPGKVGGPHRRPRLAGRRIRRAGATSIAFPNISTGVYYYPKERAAKIALAAVRDHHAGTLTDVFFACFDTENYQFYASLL